MFRKLSALFGGGGDNEQEAPLPYACLSDLVGGDSLELIQRASSKPKAGAADLNLLGLVEGESADFVSQGQEFELYLENEAHIRTFIKLMPDLIRQKIDTATKISHVAQLGGVRGVPGAVGAAGGLATGIALFLRGEIPVEAIELALKLAQSAGVGLLVMEVGYRVAGSLGKRKERDLARDMEKIAAENAVQEVMIELRDLIIKNIRIRPKTSVDVVFLEQFREKVA